MNETKIANDIKQYLSSAVFTTSESDVASHIESQASSADPIKLFAYCCQSFSRSQMDQFFVYASSLWKSFDLTDLKKLLSRIHPRPNPVWAWDGGEYSDVVFLVRTINLNVFLLVNSVEIDKGNALNILEYGTINSELLVTYANDNSNDDDVDPYYETFLKRRCILRDAVLNELPALDMEGWDEDRLNESIAACKAQMQLPQTEQ